MSSAVVRAQLPLSSTPLPPERYFPEPGRSRLLELPRGVVPGSRLEVRPAPPTVPCGIAAIEALTGGLPRGALTEIFGQASSGRTSFVLAALTEATRRQEVCALVDAGDSLHPESAAAAGMDLERLLWIRCGNYSPRRHGDTEAIDDLEIEDCRLKGKRRTTNDEQLPSAPRMNADKRGSGLIHKSLISNYQSEQNLKLGTRNFAGHGPLTTGHGFSNRQFSAWEPRLAQVLKTTDLLLQSGGFGMVVVDLAEVPPRFARRIPLASWFRFRRAVENTPTVLLVVEQEPYAKTCASLVLRMQRNQHSAVSNQHSASEMFSLQHATQPDRMPVRQTILQHNWPAHAHILRGLPVEAELVHARWQRKPVCSATQFHTRTAWADSLAG